MSDVRNRKKIWIVYAIVTVLFSVAGTRPVSAQAPVAPPASTPNQPPQVWVRASGGNHFAGPKDVVYPPTRPPEDTRLNMYFGDWRNSEPRVLFGSLVVRDILTPGDNLSPPFPGAVLEHARFLSYASLEPGELTIPSTLKDLQIFFYVEEGEGEVSAGGKTEGIHGGSAILMPEGIEFTLHNTGQTRLKSLHGRRPNLPGIQASFVLRGQR